MEPFSTYFATFSLYLVLFLGALSRSVHMSQLIHLHCCVVCQRMHVEQLNIPLLLDTWAILSIWL